MILQDNKTRKKLTVEFAKSASLAVVVGLMTASIIIDPNGFSNAFITKGIVGGLAITAFSAYYAFKTGIKLFRNIP